MAIPFVKTNMGSIDRMIRIITGLAMMYVGFIDQAIIGSLVISIIVGIFGIISIAFAYLGFCPIYTLGSISTAGKSSEDR